MKTTALVDMIDGDEVPGTEAGLVFDAPTNGCVGNEAELNCDEPEE